MDGWITIGTKLDTKQLEQQLKQQEKQLQKYEKEAEKLTTTKAKAEVDLSKYYEQKKLIQEFTDKALEYAQTEQEVARQLEIENSNLNQLNESYAKELNALTEINTKIEENKNNQGLVRQEITKTNQELERATGLKNIGADLNDMGEKTNNLLKKVSKWGLAIFGIRSAYMMVRNAMSTISQYDNQMAKNIEYIRFALAQAIKPLIEWIVNAVYKILTYINYIANAWFGINLFKNAGVGEFNKGMKTANKEAKELQKTLAGFDEANVLSDSSKNGAKEDNTLPSFDLSIQQIDVPDWVKWIADNKDLIIGLASIVGIAFGTAKVGEILGNISRIFGVAGTATGAGATGLIGLASLLTIIAGLATIAITVAYFFKDREKLKEDVQRTRELNQNMNQNYNKSIKSNEKISNLTNKTRVNLEAGEESLSQSKNLLYKITGTSKTALDNAKGVAENTDSIAEATKKMWEYEERSLDDKIEMFGLLNDQYNYNLKIIDALKEQGEETKGLEESNEKLKTLISGYRQELNNTPEYIQRINNAWDQDKRKIEEALGLTKTLNNYKITDKSFTINGTTKIDTGSLSKALDTVIAVNSGLVGKFMPSVWNNMMSQITSWRKKFGLATGGIVNMPGRGVPLGTNLIGGESGREGVIPLTDPRAMAQLGKEIGQWVNIGIENNMVVDSRVLATATNDRINKESFLMNR